MAKKLIRLTESELKNIIGKSVMRILKEGVMSRHDMAAVEGLRSVKKLAELHISVAVNARIRRCAVFVCIDKA